ncbi:3-oxoacyl-[acyl-carrier-protein] synthase [Apophysomyces ossiformis]|uniref:3-oxoacyl-[acyl-carrier-protein] synthase n=1 Tax=Apophysomyces ossiformis TaxID=679940 RepID=A0A8H7EM95_9FUNG|nr:3-oxoacyl-[acyl-carrier-protein] synthase [Apophysomyces ossiformis]
MDSQQRQQVLRPLSIKQNKTEVSILVPADIWVSAEQLKEEFPVETDELEESTEIELAARFMGFAAKRAATETQFLPVARTAFIDFGAQYLKNNDVHAITRSLASEAKQAVIQAYFDTLVVLKKHNALTSDEAKSPQSALFAAAARGDTKLFAIFGGQGNIEEYFDELADIWTTYNGLVKPFVERMAVVLTENARSSEASVFHSKGLDILRWLENPESRPDLPYLVSAPVSFPLIGLTQLLHYYVMLRILDRSPADIRQLLAGSTGHSQGIITSVVISVSATEEDFQLNAEKALGLLFWIGTRAQQGFPPTTLNPTILEDSLNNNEGNPTPMLAITGLRESQVLKHLEATNAHLADDRQIEITLHNGPRSFVCTGPPQSLYGLNLSLRKLKAETGLEQSRVPFSQRKIKFSSRFLPITAPFHSQYLKSVTRSLTEDIEKHGLKFEARDLVIPVFATDSGSDLRSSADLTLALVSLICERPVYWEKAIALKDLTHIIDFGPGATSGIGGLTHRNKEGTGVQIVLAGALEGNNRDLSYKADLFDADLRAVTYSQDWAKVFQPKLVKTTSNGRIHVDSRMSRLLGKPPLMVAGMTPSTVNEKFVAAVMNAGYHIELAGGGHYNERMLRAKVDKIMELTRPGEGITLNMLFLNVRQWGFQYPLVQVMRKEGLPMEGVCVAAGVPSLDVANEVLANLKAAGIRHVAFKPGSIETIRQVVAIAAANPTMPVIMQWTGGRAGGHHSFEDVHQPILETYASIRRQPNIVLVAGSGFGGADDTLPYLTGDWSVKFDYPPMPFDGILFGSRMMASKEGLASDAAKQAMVDAPGVDDADWEKTYKGPAGGILTVRSELGEPIHKVATRGVRLWKELDESIFNLPKDKRLPALLAKKDYIIKRLNADFQKVWFGKKKNGDVVDLQEMTYVEVVNRMIELLYVKHEMRWIDPTLRNLVGDFLRRIEERFSNEEVISKLQSFSQLENPFDFVPEFLAQFPEADTQLLASADVLHFVTLCQRRGQKPVPFIPVMDKDFDVWFKKDSLWQSEDLGAVVDQDVQRTCILHGPVAAKYTTRMDQPVGEILGDIYDSHIKSLKERYYNNDESTIPEIEYLGGEPITKTGVTEESATESESVYTVGDNGSSIPAEEDWFQTISGPQYNWLRALLTSPFVVQEKRFVDNPLKRIFRPRAGQRVLVSKANGRITAIKVQDKRLWSATGKSADFVTSVQSSITNNLIDVYMYEKRAENFVPLHLKFEYKPELGYAPVHEIMEGRNDRIKDFYYKLWFGMESTDDFLNFSVTEKLVGKDETVQSREVKEFCQAVGNQAEIYVDRGQKIINAPMDFAIVVGWKAIIKAIFPKVIDGDLLKLVHLSNGFRLLDGNDLLKVGDVVDTYADINAIINTDSGKLIEVKGIIVRDNKPVLEVTSQFLYRGQFDDFEHTFERKVETPMELKLKTNKDIAVLKSKEWVQWSEELENYELAPGSSLIFRLSTELKYKNKKVFSSVRTSGTISMQLSTKEFVQIGKVEYEAGESHGNPVIEYLKRHGQEIEQAHFFENGGYSVMPTQSSYTSVVHAPASNEPYANVSGDFNPIHVNPYFADLALLPGTITHGMWTSASTRKFVEIFAADNVPRRVVAYDVKFVGMVLPSDRLETKLSHTGMKNGRKIIKIETINQNNEKVVEGTAEVEQPVTAYVFTGQGSQEQGMGMALYASSPVAKVIWDRADKHFMQNYGFSILEIVRDNPKEKTVHFGGPRGNAIRQNYMSMSYDVVEADGTINTLPLFPTIHERTASYTFRAPNGLLSATQFTQPALTLMEKAAFEDMRSKELIQSNCAFAGHSLGEYAALASVGDVLPLESLVDVVFYRGMTMQSAVKRDAEGRSNYGMAAVNPARVSKSFNDTALRYVVDSIARQSGEVLEIVNFNVENWQYVTAGSLQNLDVLANVLNYLKTSNIDLQKLMETMPLEEVKKHLANIIEGALEKTREKTAKHGRITLERGYATVPLPGIDVPFHSSFLLSGVSPFRTYLAKKFTPTNIDLAQLTAKYIPNLTAEPFSTKKSYIENVYNLTSSPRLGKVLKQWTDDKYATPGQQQRLGYILLVELLAYQFASPVRWIETQDQLFKHYQIERLIEIGPSPTLSGMATRTLNLKYQAYDNALSNRRQNMCISKDAKEIYYEFENPVEEVNEPVAAPSPAAPAPSAAAVPAVAAAPVPAPSAGPAAPVSDAPVTATEVIHVVIAQKLKKSVDEVPLSKAVKDLVGGKSTLQNEILGDLQKEFNNAVPEKAEETPLDELGASLDGSFGGTLGKHTSSLVAKMISAKMPGGFTLNSAKTYLSTTYGLGNGRIEGTLLMGLTMEPAARLGSEAEAKAWLDSVAQGYAKKAGISLSTAGSGAGAAGAAGAVAVINSEEFDALKAQQNNLIYQQLNLYARYLNHDLREGHKKYEQEKVTTMKLQAELDQWLVEQGDVYAEGIKPVFSPLKARRYDSYWNWVRQDALTMWYDIIFGKLAIVDREVTAKCLTIMNRAYPQLIDYMRYNVENCAGDKGETYRLAKQFGQALIENCVEVLAENPVYKDVAFPTGPSTTITEKGDIKYAEVPRPGCRKFAHYVKNMAAGSKVTEYSNRLKVQQNLGRIYKIIRNQNKMKKTSKLAIKELYGDVLRAMSMSNTIVKEPRSRQRRLSSTAGRTVVERKRVSAKSAKTETIPFLHLKKKNVNDPSGWEYSNRLTTTYLDVLGEIAENGISFAEKCVLLTGAGKDSIGSEVLKGLVAGGAKVVVTTSRFSRQVTEYFQSIYQTYGSRGSELIVVPFNQGSRQDVDALVDYIYDPKGLNWDLDFVIPFAAIPENGREIDSIDSKSELAHRIMLTNLLRLLGSVKSHKQAIGSDTRPAQVILPLSPNHGTFGSDGLYSESKISLETLFNRWFSESWSDYLLIAGAVIGWTRGTGLMSPNNMISEGVEALGIRTFSTVEMSFNILGLMHPSIVELCQTEPVWADLNGGFQFIPNLQEVCNNLRKEIRETAEIRSAIAAENSLDFKIVNGAEAERKYKPHKVTPRANMKFDFPKLKPYQSLKHLSHLKGMLDLDKVIVVTGFGEVSPWGNARTRWEMEAYGEFSLEGCIEMAWIMGFIKHHHGNLKSGPYSGWVDAKTNEPVEDKDIKAKYEKQILEHSGIRFIDPTVMNGYDPSKKMLMQEIVVDHDLEPFECSQEEAQHFKHQQGDKADVYESDNGSWIVVLRKGATLYVPKALRFDRLVAGQIPTGWDAARYGVPKDIIEQVDPVSLFNIVSTVEAFVSSGITDPYEFFKYVHVSEIGNTTGSGVGGQQAQRGLFRDRLLDKPVQKDILQESFINTMPAWINMLLLSASGPIKTPVNACATSAVSVELAVDSILTGKAKIMIAGATEDITEESSYEFANMKATSNAVDELEHGRTPAEMSRPATTTRNGFMEAHGAANHILMSAATAIEIGAPIYGIIALTNTASDKEGRSVPAPGAGILTTAREKAGNRPSPLLDFKYRARQIRSRRVQIKAWVEAEYDALREELEDLKAAGQLTSEDEKAWLAERSEFIQKEAKRQEKEALSTWSMSFYQQDPAIAPLRGALAVYGLTIDDINVASFHGTSTKANDKNESRVLNSQLKHLGRSKGNALLAITQKYLTGHPKGPAASWMANGLIQCLNSGLVPGNRNADNVDEVLKEFEYIVYPSRSIQTDGLKAGLLKSFGFGQAGGEMLIIHPDYVLAALEESAYETYKAKNAQRYAKSYRYLHDSLTGVSDFVQVKDAAPYTDELEHKVYLNPRARAEYSKEKRTWVFNAKSVTADAAVQGDAEGTQSILASLAEQQAGKKGVGVDVELNSAVNIDNATFVERNFTPEEIKYCLSRPDPQASFAGRWSAKEAVFKAISSHGHIASDGAGAPLIDIEILPNDVGAPEVVLSGKAQAAATAAGIKKLNVSISHSGAYSVAVALSQ